MFQAIFCLPLDVFPNNKCAMDSRFCINIPHRLRYFCGQYTAINTKDKIQNPLRSSLYVFKTMKKNYFAISLPRKPEISNNSCEHECELDKHNRFRIFQKIGREFAKNRKRCISCIPCHRLILYSVLPE